MRYMILDGKDLVPADPETCGRWFEENRSACVVAQVRIGPHVRVTTLFCGLQRNVGAEVGEPLYFSTIVFRDERPEERGLYPTWGAAEAGHMELVEELERELGIAAAPCPP